MGYIYCITNLINSKRYIGQTNFSIEERFKEHIADSKKDRCKNRPLYSAFNKYGIENFIIEQIEEVDSEKLNEKEIFWIKEYHSYGSFGYNATSGGDGHTLYDHKEILELYNLGYSVSQISDKIGCDRSVILKVLKANGLKSRGSSKMIDQFDLAGNFIQTFDSSKAAKEWLIIQQITTNKSAHKAISDVCSGRRKNPLYGYKWSYKQIPQ